MFGRDLLLTLTDCNYWTETCETRHLQVQCQHSEIMLLSFYCPGETRRGASSLGDDQTNKTRHNRTQHTKTVERRGWKKNTHKGKKGKALNQEWNSTGIKELTENQTKVELKDWRKLKLKKLTKVKIRDKWSLKVTGNTARLKLKDQNNWSKVKLKVKGNQIRVELKNLNN